MAQGSREATGAVEPDVERLGLDAGVGQVGLMRGEQADKVLQVINSLPRALGTGARAVG